MSYSIHRKCNNMNDYRVDFHIDINIVEDIFLLLFLYAKYKSYTLA